SLLDTKEVGEAEPVARYRGSPTEAQGRSEDRPGVTEGMELAILAARIHAEGDFIQQFCVEVASRKVAPDSRHIARGEHSTQAAGKHVPGQRWRVLAPAPEREQRLQSAPLKEPLAVGADVLQIKISEGDVCHTLTKGLGQCVAHSAL